MRTQPYRGFTLIELLMVLAILAILAVLVIPLAQTSLKRAKEQELTRDLREIRNGLDNYKRAYDEGRIARQVNDSGYPHTLEELVSGVEDIRDPKHSKMYFLRRIPPDPFSQIAPGMASQSWNVRSYASDPNDPQPGKDVFDIFTSSPDVGLNGVPYRQW